MNYTYLTPEKLAEKLDCKPQTLLRGKALKSYIEGIHFVYKLGSNRKLFIWENIERDMLRGISKADAIPMARGGYCHG